MQINVRNLKRPTEMLNERSFVKYKIFKYGCSRIFIERKHYRMYIQNFSKVGSMNIVDGNEIPVVEKGIH